MADEIYCDTHGESEKSYVCSHLADTEAVALGFNRAEPDDENPFPDAWCNACDLVRIAHDGWTDEAQELVSICLLCSECYELVRIRNTQTDVTLDDLNHLRWKCYSCEDWHTGPCLDFSYEAPIYWDDDAGAIADRDKLSAAEFPKFFLDDDLCIIDGDYFVRGIIELPIIGTAETFCWGVWGSLSEASFKKLLAVFDDHERVELEPMFSWLSNQIDEYEDDTLNLKMNVCVREPGQRPAFDLQPTDHPLAQEYYQGISAERVKEIMSRRLNDVH